MGAQRCTQIRRIVLAEGIAMATISCVPGRFGRQIRKPAGSAGSAPGIGKAISPVPASFLLETRKKGSVLSPDSRCRSEGVKWRAKSKTDD